METYKKPKVSFIMGIYNCESTLEKSIKSIINQTYTNWELVMCDDGSIDNTYEIAEKYANIDSRIRVIKNEKNQGLAFSLNRCIDNAEGKYIARQDADDYSKENRLEIQIEFLENNLEYGFVSSAAFLFDDNGVWGERNTKQYSPNKLDLAKKNPFIHPTVIIRREIINSVNGYTAEKHTYRTEDYDLWFKLYSKGTKGFILEEKLYYFNESQSSYSRKKFKYRIDESKVRLDGYKNLNISKKYYALALRPIIIGLVPKNLLRSIHRINSKG